MSILEININIDRPVNLKYDASLFEVYVLDYGDNYHRLENEPSSEFERAVRNIRARYRSLSKFNDALNLYTDWMDYLAEKHGGKDILKKKIKAGIVEDYIPRKPRLKNNRTLKYMYKHNIIVSENHGGYIDMEKLDDYIDEVYPEVNENLNEIQVYSGKSKEADKIVSTFGATTPKRITTHAFADDMDFIDSYFKGRNIKSNNKKKKSKKKNHNKSDDKFLLMDVINGYYDYNESDVEESDNAPFMMYNGLILNSGTTREMDTYRRLDELGWHSYKLMKRANYSKRTASVFKPKKKGKKKKKKGFDVQSSYDDLIIDIAQDAGYDNFEEFSKDMLNMTAANIFK